MINHGFIYDISVDTRTFNSVSCLVHNLNFNNSRIASIASYIECKPHTSHQPITAEVHLPPWITVWAQFTPRVEISIHSQRGRVAITGMLLCFAFKSGVSNWSADWITRRNNKLIINTYFWIRRMPRYLVWLKYFVISLVEEYCSVEPRLSVMATFFVLAKRPNILYQLP